jgi:hypothetical protein
MPLALTDAQLAAITGAADAAATRRNRSRLALLRRRCDRYSRAVISRVNMPSSSTYQSPMSILTAGNTS